jgi:hypothetical protein
MHPSVSVIALGTVTLTTVVEDAPGELPAAASAHANTSPVIALWIVRART